DDVVRHERETCHVAARAREAIDDAGLKRVYADGEDDRDALGSLLCRESPSRRGRDDEVNAETDQLSRKPWELVVFPSGPSILDEEVPTLDITKLAHALDKGALPLSSARTGRERAEPVHLPRLRSEE